MAWHIVGIQILYLLNEWVNEMSNFSQKLIPTYFSITQWSNIVWVYSLSSLLRHTNYLILFSQTPLATHFRTFWKSQCSDHTPDQWNPLRDRIHTAGGHPPAFSMCSPNWESLQGSCCFLNTIFLVSENKVQRPINIMTPSCKRLLDSNNRHISIVY